MTHKVHTIIICILLIKELKPSVIRSLPQITELASGKPAQSYFKAHALKRLITASHCLRYYIVSPELAAD